MSIKIYVLVPLSALLVAALLLVTLCERDPNLESHGIHILGWCPSQNPFDRDSKAEIRASTNLMSTAAEALMGGRSLLERATAPAMPGATLPISPNKILQQPRYVAGGLPLHIPSQRKNESRVAVVAGRAVPLHPSQLCEILPEVLPQKSGFVKGAH